MKKRRFLAQLLLSGVFLLFWLRWVDFGFFFSSLKKVNGGLVLAAGLIYLTAGFLRGVRFKLVLDLIVKRSVMEVFAINNLSAMINYLLPLRAGELVKPIFIKNRQRSVSGSKVLSVVLVDKMGDLFSMFFLILALTPVVLGVVNRSQLILASGFLLLISFLTLFVLIWRNKKILSFVSFLCSLRLLRVVPLPFWVYLRRFLAGFSLFSKKKLFLAGIFCFSILETFLDGIVFYLVFLSFGFSVSLPAAILGLTLMYFSFLIPSAPGFVGTFEVAGMVVLVFGLKVSKDEAAMAVAFYHLLSSLILFLAALWSAWYLKEQGVGFPLKRVWPPKIF